MLECLNFFFFFLASPALNEFYNMGICCELSPLQILPGWSCVFGGESDFIRYRLSFGNH